MLAMSGVWIGALVVVKVVALTLILAYALGHVQKDKNQPKEDDEW